MNNELRISKELNAPIEMVYEAWLSAESIKEWMCPAEGVTVPNPVLDAKVGGKFDFSMRVGTSLLPHTGEYKTLERPTKIQFTWNSENAGHQGSLVTIELENLGNDRTLLKLHHEMLPSKDEREKHQGGWSRVLDCLEKHFLER